MQPNRYINELEHWRHTSQRPHRHQQSPDRSPAHSPTIPATTVAADSIATNLQRNGQNSLEHDHATKSPSSAFPIEAPRGWLEYSLVPPSTSYTPEGSSTHAGPRVTANKDDTTDKSNGKHVASSQTIASLPVALSTSADTASSTSGVADSQTARDMLGAVSYEDIVKLTQMTAHLPETSLVSKYPVGRGHNRKNSEEPRQTKEHVRTVSASRPSLFEDTSRDAPQQHLAENITTMTQEPIFARPSMSTPPPSSSQAPLMPRPLKPFDPLKNERRRSWYKQLVKRDKPKPKPTDSALLRRHPSHIPSSPCDTSLPMMRAGSHSSDSSDLRQISTTQQLESTAPSAGSEDLSSIDYDPETNSRKRSALHPGTFIKDRLRKASPVESSEGGSSAFTPRNRIDLSSRRRSLDSMQSEIQPPTTEDEHRSRRRSSADDKKNPIVFFKRKTPRQPETDSPNRPKPEATDVFTECDIRPSFDFSYPSHDDFSPRGEGESDSPRLYPSGSEDGIKSMSESISDQISIISGTIETSEEGDSGSVAPEEPEETSRTLVFDYASLPDEVLGLLREYEKQGKLEIAEKRIRNDHAPEREDEFEEESEGESIIDASHVVGGVPALFDSSNNYDQNDTGLTTLRRIATVRARKSDKEEFVKLIHLTDGNSMQDGYLLDLHVSMLGDSDGSIEDEVMQEDLQMLLTNMDKRIEELKVLAQGSNSYIEEKWKTIEPLVSESSSRSPQESSSQQSQRVGSRKQSTKITANIKESALSQAIEDGTKQSRRKKRTASVGSAASSPSSTSSTNTVPAAIPARGIQQSSYSSLRRAPSTWLERHLPYRSVNPFDYRQEEVLLGVRALENEMTEFRLALYETEDLIRNIQLDIGDTREKMTSYIKDMPDTHYSALKKLEVDIEGILANRAKNPWLDTGYAILSYILTLFALLVWIIICGLKWGRTVIFFPGKFWRAYSDHLAERNKAVKKASIRTVSSGVELNTSMSSSARPRHPPQDI